MPNLQRHPQGQKNGRKSRTGVEPRTRFAVILPPGEIEILESQLPLMNCSGSTLTRLIERIKSL